MVYGAPAAGSDKEKKKIRRQRRRQRELLTMGAKRKRLLHHHNFTAFAPKASAWGCCWWPEPLSPVAPPESARRPCPSIAAAESEKTCPSPSAGTHSRSARLCPR